MYLLKKVAKRQEGMSFKLTKFHGIVHIADDILNLGVPLEVDTGFNESGHKATKTAAKLTQRNEATFDKQVAIRMEEVSLISLAICEIQGQFTSYFGEPFAQKSEQFAQKNESVPVGGAVYTVNFNQELQKYEVELTTNPMTKPKKSWKQT